MIGTAFYRTPQGTVRRVRVTRLDRRTADIEWFDQTKRYTVHKGPRAYNVATRERRTVSVLALSNFCRLVPVVVQFPKGLSL